MEIVKDVKEWGNSAGVLLPKEWKGKEVKVILIDRSSEIKKEVFDILSDYLEDIMGIYLVGSYARSESKKRSDIDLLVITNKTNKRIEKSKYDFILISKENIEQKLKKNILPLLPMLKEAKPLLNAKLIEKYKKTELTKRNLKFHIETTKSAMKMNKAAINLNKELSVSCSDTTAYSLVLRLREIYIVNCLMKNKIWNNKRFIKLLKEISGSLTAYRGYLRVKDNEKTEKELSIKEAEKIHDYITEKIKEQEKWLKRK